jgi:hypothetical protein
VRMGKHLKKSCSYNHLDKVSHIFSKSKVRMGKHLKKSCSYNHLDKVSSKYFQKLFVSFSRR